MPSCRPLLVSLALLLPTLAARADGVDFKRDVYPILSTRCFSCHEGADARSGYRLDLRAEILGETNGKPLVRLREADKSRLLHLVREAVPGKRMPPKGEPLTAAQINTLKSWIDQGLAWDETLLPGVQKSTHWAFQPVQRGHVPRPKNAAWVRTPVDAFIASAHEAKGITPAAHASKSTLIRRLSLDLTGLPPTPEEVASFERDTSPGAYEKLVDRLLASPAYGERWGRYWLDLARWAESEGYESDHLRPYAWRYRDYVVASFNADKPYDRFLREQIAGDEIEPYTNENLIATGFLAAARLSSNEEDKARQRNDVLVDIVNATGGAILGLTIQCGQCHSHKFDPITARDYYRLQGFFVKGMPNNLTLEDSAGRRKREEAKPAEYEPAKRLMGLIFDAAKAKLTAQVRKSLSAEQLAALDTPSDRRNTEQQRIAAEADLKFQFLTGQVEKAIPESDRPLYTELKKKVAAIEEKLPDAPQTWGFYSPATSPTKVDVLPMKGFYPPAYVPAVLAGTRPYLLVTGDVHQRGPEVDVGWPAVFGPTPSDRVRTRPRTALVDWLVSERHPLTARVWVNRIWQHHFGRGLVATPSDFGLKGAKPTHPELLDWLASELRERGWSTKHIHRLIVCSSTYQQAARGAAANTSIDPDNALLWHWPIRRLEAEAIRDSMLAVSGELDRDRGGPGDIHDATSLRRTLYLHQKREKANMVQRLFDGPTNAAESCPKRHVATIPLQALYLLNHEFTLKRADAFAKRVTQSAGTDRHKQVTVAFELALGRLPNEREREAAERFFASADGPNALAPFCQAILNLNEFVYLE